MILHRLLFLRKATQNVTRISVFVLSLRHEIPESIESIAFNLTFQAFPVKEDFTCFKNRSATGVKL